MPTSSSMKRRVRERMKATGEKYTTALRALEAEAAQRQRTTAASTLDGSPQDASTMPTFPAPHPEPATLATPGR